MAQNITVSSAGTNFFETWVFLYAVSGVAILVLLISCVNFVNLTVARFLQRSREIGVRKAIGAGRKHIFSQFLSESLMLIVVAVVLGLIVANSLLPLYGNLIEIDLVGVQYVTPVFLSALCGLVLFTALLSGFYPALILSKVSPVVALQKSGTSYKKSIALRIVNVLQFAAVILLVTPCLALVLQANLLKNFDFGADLDNVVELMLVDLYGREQPDVLRGLLAAQPDVTSVSSTISPFGVTSYAYKLEREDSNEIQLNSSYVSHSLFNHLKTDLAAGRLFVEGDVEKSIILDDGGISRGGAVILTQIGLSKLGYGQADQAVGKKLYIADLDIQFEIVGVVTAFPPIAGGECSCGRHVYAERK